MTYPAIYSRNAESDNVELLRTTRKLSSRNKKQAPANQKTAGVCSKKTKGNLLLLYWKRCEKFIGTQFSVSIRIILGEEFLLPFRKSFLFEFAILLLGILLGY